MNGNIPINELQPDVDVWLVLCVTSVHRGQTRQGKRYCDAVARNASGAIRLKCWQETIERCGDLKPGLSGVTGRLRWFQEQPQFIVASHRSVALEIYRRFQESDPLWPRAFTLDIETLPQPGYRERVVRNLRFSYEQGTMAERQRLRYAYDQEGETEQVYRAGALSGAFGRVLSVAVHTGPKAEFASGETACEEHVFGITESGEEEPERQALEGFLNLLKGFDPETDELVSQNGTEFDLPLILQRCLAHGLPVPPVPDPSSYRPRGLFDTCRRWFPGARRGAISLDDLAWALGLETSKSEELSGPGCWIFTSPEGSPRYANTTSPMYV
jgi:hypothetical protein